MYTHTATQWGGGWVGFFPFVFDSTKVTCQILSFAVINLIDFIGVRKDRWRKKLQQFRFEWHIPRRGFSLDLIGSESPSPLLELAILLCANGT